MKKRSRLPSIFLMFFMAIIFIVTTVQVVVSGITLNDNINVEGEVFLEGAGCGILFCDGTHQTTGPMPSWSRKITGDRFELVLYNENEHKYEAVLDHETGLVWQRTTYNVTRDWYIAQSYCYALLLGGRQGWRLPTIDELATLIDSSQPSPKLPAGHPFTDIPEENAYYWSATPDDENPDYAWRVVLKFGTINRRDKGEKFYVRAVRAPR